MKNKVNKIQSAEIGAKIAPYVQAGQFLGTTIQGVSETGSTGDFVGSGLSGAASGAAAGAALGPVGAIGGAVVGLAGGLFGASSRKREQRRAQRQARNQAAFHGALRGTNEAISDYYDEYGYGNAFEKGGSTGYSPVYLNDGETIVHPDGTVKRIPKKGRKVDSVLSMEPVGSLVFGGVVDPDTGVSYSDMAENMLKPTKKNSNDMYAENAKKLNKINANLLFAKQEETKAKQGIKPKYKNLGVQAADTGTIVWRNPLGALNPHDEYKKVAETFPTEQVANNMHADTGVVDAMATNIKTKRDYEKQKQAEYRAKTNDALANIASLTPVAYNFLQGTRKSEYQSPRFNINTPYALRQLRNRYDLLGAMNDIRNAANIGYYNVNTTGNTTGGNMAQRTAIALGTQRAIANQYDAYNSSASSVGAARAQLATTAGQQDAEARKYADDVNARNRAARRAFTTAAIEGLGKWGQNRILMANQRERDLSILPYLRDYLAHGSTNQYNV